MSIPTKVVSFYSFKGGTGRTTSLANTSYALADMGNNVGCMDLDLAAPGLHMVFPEIGRAHDSSRTIHDYILGDHDDNSKNDLNMDKYTIDVGEKIGNTREYRQPDGDLLLLSGEVKKPVDDNPKTMVQKTIELMRMFISYHDLDYLLLDARSGLSSHIVPLITESDKLFSFHRWTAQHKMGTKEPLNG
ncbi:AAA family ATPase [Halonotius sp. GCM10025705]|uniref:AAA family ATPase n=1 Tax=Halonotius sp. GCM10025705 TaxID=3252678 RepID=UPI003608897B